MPYHQPSDAPSYVPDKHRAQWIAIWNSAYERAKNDGKSDKESESSAFAQSNGVAGPSASKRFEILIAKATQDEIDAFVEALLAAMQQEFEELPSDISNSLEDSALSGVGQGMLQIEMTNSGMITAANTIAHEYATERAAELVGMKRDLEGNLIPNPNAKWAISDTTRERVREIVTDAFAEETSIDEIQSLIQQALEEEADEGGIFSQARARMIAETEVARAQVGGNFAAWQKSGVVEKIKWTTSEDEKVCEECEGNDGAEVELGHPFPDGSIIPPGHPLCRCVVIVSKLLTS